MVKVLQGIRTQTSKLGPKKQNFFGRTVRSLALGFFLKKKIFLFVGHSQRAYFLAYARGVWFSKFIAQCRDMLFHPPN